MFVGPSQGRGRGMLRGMGWDPSHSTSWAVLKLGRFFQGGRHPSRDRDHSFCFSGWAGEAGEGKAGHGQGSSTEKGGSKARRGICFSICLPKAPGKLIGHWSTKPGPSSELGPRCHSGILAGQGWACPTESRLVPSRGHGWPSWARCEIGLLAPWGARQILVHLGLCNSPSFCQREREPEGTTWGGKALNTAGRLRVWGRRSDGCVTFAVVPPRRRDVSPEVPFFLDGTFSGL